MKQQLGDQTLKGGVLGILSYLAWKAEVDPEFVALCLPVISGLLAWLSTQIGDPNLASIFDAETKKSGLANAVRAKVSKK
jgi:hypothetical protein